MEKEDIEKEETNVTEGKEDTKKREGRTSTSRGCKEEKERKEERGQPDDCTGGRKKKNKAKWILSELRAVGNYEVVEDDSKVEGYQKKDEEKEARTRARRTRARRRKGKKRNDEGAGRVGGERGGEGRNGEEEEERGQSGRPSLRNVN